MKPKRIDEEQTTPKQGSGFPIVVAWSAVHRSLQKNAITKGGTTMAHARQLTVILIAVLALLGTVPRIAAAKSEVPFKATITELFEMIPCDAADQVCFSLVGNGHASHLGKTSATTQVIVDLSSAPGPTPDCHTNTRPVMTLTAANGDQITLRSSGVSCDTGATSGVTGISRDTYIVTGGTGRFSGASGGGTATVSIYGADGFSRIVLSGTLSSPGSR